MKGKPPVRPRRDGEDLYTSDEGMESATEPILRERTASPENGGRSKSPVGAEPIRAMSPQGEAYMNGIGGVQTPANMANIAMQRNALAARSPSPVVDRARSPPDGFYATGRASPTVNGYGSVHGHGTRPGSTGNVTADLIRDLKTKELEVGALKAREAWMKVALKSAANAGFAYPEQDVQLVDSEKQSPGSDEPDIKGLVNLIVRLKQDQARIQVRIYILLSQYIHTNQISSRANFRLRCKVLLNVAMSWNVNSTLQSKKLLFIEPSLLHMRITTWTMFLVSIVNAQLTSNAKLQLWQRNVLNMESRLQNSVA